MVNKEQINSMNAPFFLSLFIKLNVVHMYTCLNTQKHMYAPK